MKDGKKDFQSQISPWSNTSVLDGRAAQARGTVSSCKRALSPEAALRESEHCSPAICLLRFTRKVSRVAHDFLQLISMGWPQLTCRVVYPTKSSLCVCARVAFCFHSHLDLSAQQRARKQLAANSPKGAGGWWAKTEDLSFPHDNGTGNWSRWFKELGNFLQAQRGN